MIKIEEAAKRLEKETDSSGQEIAAQRHTTFLRKTTKDKNREHY
jgi:hypothetical protein